VAGLLINFIPPIYIFITALPHIGSPTPSPAVGIVSFTSVSNGTYDLIFQLNGTEYKGSFIATDSDVTIAWPAKSGVTISPLTIQKQH